MPNEAVLDEGYDRTQTLTATPAELASIADGGREHAEDRTNLFFLKGDPGAGKTTVLRELAALQARRYLEGDTDFLFFYVSAQGRELSNLRDAFSGELQDLRAGFTRDAIATLARAGLLIPVIDGFDELLGTAGYSGAFSSLQGLLGELEGKGALLVSARSAFYDIEFLGRSVSPVDHADISITTIALDPWTEEQLGEYLQRRGAPDNVEHQREVLERVTPADRELLRRPFFASQFPQYARDSAQGEVPLLQYLINAYIEREAEKIVDANGDPVLPVDGHRRLFELTAAEMWDGEARQLSGDDLRTLTEVVSEEFELGSDQAAQLATKVTSYAGFQLGTRDDFTFEHEVYFDYFLSEAVRRYLQEVRTDELLLFLDRGVVPEGVAATAVRGVTNGQSPDPRLLRCSSGVRYDNRRRNLGAIIAAWAREIAPLEGLEVENLNFIDLAVGSARFSKVRFAGCLFFGADLGDTTFTQCDAASSSFQGVSVNDASELGIADLKPGKNVGTVSHPAVGDLYEPNKVQELLERLGAPSAGSRVTAPIRYSDKAEVLIKLLHLLARGYRRTTLLYENDHLRHQLFDDKHWPELKRLLLDHEVISQEVRGVSGAKTNALRLRVSVDNLLVGQTSSELSPGPVSELWKALRRA